MASLSVTRSNQFQLIPAVILIVLDLMVMNVNAQNSKHAQVNSSEFVAGVCSTRTLRCYPVSHLDAHTLLATNTLSKVSNDQVHSARFGLEGADTDDPFTVGGYVTGLAAGNSLVLQNNRRNDLIITSNGGFEFSKPLLDGSNYSVSVSSQPQAPNQQCAVKDARGRINQHAVTTIQVVCRTQIFTVGGAIDGLAEGAALVLHNNTGEELTVVNNGRFSFQAGLADETEYRVSIVNQAENQYCRIENNSGSVRSSQVTDVRVGCQHRRPVKMD